MTLVRVIIFLALLFCSQSLQGQDTTRIPSIEEIYRNMVAECDTSELFQITFPDDGDTFYVSQVRYGAWTRDTSAVVTVADMLMKVYPSGAFVGRFQLQPGWNDIPFRIESSQGIVERVFRLYRVPPQPILNEKPTLILNSSQTPAGDVIYYAPDKLKVRFYGSPGGKATFSIKGLTPGKLPMTELPAIRTGGRTGVYEGVYKIKETDQCEGRKIKFELKGKKDWKKKRKSKARVSVKQTGQFRLIKTKNSYNLLRYAAGGEISMILPDGILFQVIADYGRWLKIKVSEEHSAYILENSVNQAPAGMDLPEAALHGISATADSNWINIKFNLTEKIPFDLVQRTSPERVSVYFYRTHFQDEWSVYPHQDSLIDHFDWYQEDDDLLRFDIYLNTQQQWGFKGWFEGTTFYLALRKPPDIRRSNPFTNLTIALDAGHGGEHKGAVGATGIMEKDVNLVYMYYLSDLLERAGAKVVITRSDDQTMSLQSRIDIASTAQADLFIWMHNNSTAWTNDPLEEKGTSTYYTHLQAWSFARSLYPYLLELGLEPEGEVHRTYYVTRYSAMPVYLVEGAFLSNPEDEMFLLKDENLRRLAGAVFEGLEERLLQLAQ